MAQIQTQPEGPGLFSQPVALPVAHVEQLHDAASASLAEKMAAGSCVDETSTDPRAMGREIV